MRQRRKREETERKEIPNLEGAEMEGESNNSLSEFFNFNSY